MDDTAFIWIVILWIYFLPALLAWKNHHRQSSAIFAVNLLLGWCMLGWIGALVWALYREHEHPEI